MKRVLFVSGEDLLDVDMPIVKEIHNNYDFIWIIILKGYGWFSENDIQKFCEQNSINFIIKQQQFKLKSPKTLLFHFRILSTLKSINADLIYDSYLGVPYMHFFTKFFINKRKFVIAIHDVVQHHKMGNRKIREVYYNLLMRSYHNIHLFSQNQFEIFTKSFPGKNVLVAPLYLKDFGKSKNFVTKDTKIYNFLFFGIIRENKGIDLLIKAVNELSKNYSNFKVTIAGKSADNCWEKYQDLIECRDKYNLNIHTIPNEQVAELMSNADFLVLPYRDVTQSGVLLTAYNYDLPVIATDLTGFNEYVQNGKTGFVFENENIKSLTDSMTQAIRLTENEYSNLRSNLREFIKTEISISAISAKYVAYFNQILYR